MNASIDVCADTGCFHCGLPVLTDQWQAEIQGQSRQFCCPGCLSVAQAIHANGLDAFYGYRDSLGDHAQNDKAEVLTSDFSHFDVPDVQSEWVHITETDSGQSVNQVTLFIGGITCAACVWLIEQHLQRQEGVISARVNAASAQCVLTWQNQSLSKLMAAIASLGYQPQPANADTLLDHQQQEQKRSLQRLGVAGLGMMQVGMVSMGAYFGADAAWETYLRFISAIIATPVVLFSARPFFVAAWRALKQKHLVMDVPVSLAIGLAYGASLWATVKGGGEVYFDSVSMFTFFLLLGRHLEMRARYRNRLGSHHLQRLLPLTAARLEPEIAEAGETVIPLKALRAGDRVRVAAGQSIPCDGEVLDGESTVEEALLTGEADAILKQVGDKVVAGSLNGNAPLTLRATAVGKQTQLASMEALSSQAEAEKPKAVQLADRWAGRFVGAVLLLCLFVGGFWWWRAPDEAFWIVLSLLVVTCPCALSLATPTALTAAIARLRHVGLLVTQSPLLSVLPKVDCVVLDKTGTLTEGLPSIIDTPVVSHNQAESHWSFSPEAESAVLKRIAALESGVSHPMAAAFAPWQGHYSVSRQKVEAGGVSGMVNGERLWFGHQAFIAEQLAANDHDVQRLSQVCSGEKSDRLLLANAQGVIAEILWQDPLRESAQAAIHTLRQQGVRVELLSGDPSSRAQILADQLRLDGCRSGQTSQQKLAYVQQLQEQGHHVLMVGDGINDVPVLSAASASMSLGSATQLAKNRADGVLLHGDLTLIPRAIEFARHCQTTTRQNLIWAIGYNGAALPLAALGLIPPWAAAIGMSVSSLIVVVNALRLTRVKV